MRVSHRLTVATGVLCRRRIVPRSLRFSLVMLSALAASRAALGASGNNIWYVGATSGSWQVDSSWGSGILNTIVPGATSGTTNTDTATFDSGSIVTAITPDASRNLKNITFDTSAAAYTIGTTGGNPLLMTSFGTIQIASTFSASNLTETINAPLTLEGDYTLADNSAHTGVSLDFGGAISAADKPGGGSVLTVAGTGNTAISGAIGGIKTIDLVKSGAGTLTLSGNNTFTGGVTIDAGTLLQANPGALNSSLPNSVAFGPGSTGTLTLQNSAITVSGLTTNATVGSPVVQTFGNGVNSDLTVNNASDNTYGGVLKDGPGGGPLGLIKSGAGTLTLSGNNTFTGGVTINAGNLKIGNPGALNNNALYNSVTFGKFGLGSTGTLSLNGNSIDIYNLNTSTPVGSPAIQNASAAPATLTVYGDGSFAGVLQDGAGGGALALVVRGFLTLAGNNTFTGGVTINGTALVLANPGALNSSSPNAVAFTGAGELLLEGYNVTISGLDCPGPVSNFVVADFSDIPATLTVNIAANASSTYAGVLEDAGSAPLSIVKSGAGALTLGGISTYTGSTSVSGGTLRGGAANAFSQASALTVAGGATFDLGGFAQSIGSLAGAGLVTTEGTTGSDTLTVGSDNTSTSFSGLISNAASGRTLALTKVGAGTLVLSGNNTFTGGVTINAGTLQLANSTALGALTVVLNGGALRAAAFNLSSSSLAGFGGTSTSVTGAGTGWTVNNTAITSNPINNNVLLLTDGAGNEARAAYSNTLQPIALGSNGFSASYTYAPSSPNLASAADGAVFVLQVDARGLNAIGGTGGGFAYTSENGTAVQPSVAIALNIYGGHVIGTNLLTNGNPNGDTYLPVTPVNLKSGNPIDVSLVYNPVAQTITETLNEENTFNTFTHVYSTGDLAAAIGSNDVYVGFGGGTGEFASTQTISNFKYIVTGPATAGVYPNNVMLNGGTSSTVDVAPSAAGPTVAIRALSVGSGAGTTLNVTATTAPTDQAYGLIFGATTLAGNVTFNVANNDAGTGTLTLGAVSDGGSNSSISKTGAGTLTLSGTNSLSGATTVMGGTLNTAGSGTIGTGALTISTANGVTTAVNLGNSQTVSSLSGTLAGSVPTLSLAGGVTLTDNQSSGNTLFPGLLINSGAFVKSGSSSLELNGAPTLNADSVLKVSGGTLRFNIFVGGAATIGTGVTATVSTGATLELANSVSALSSGANRVNITNNSTAPGIIVSGTHQQVGNIDGNGTTQVNAGSDLTANHIIQSALVIGGTAGSHGLVTIDPSDSAGNPLDSARGGSLAEMETESIGSSVAGSKTSSDPLGVGVIGSPGSIAATGSSVPESSSMLAVSTSSTDGLAAGTSAATVPEPSSWLLLEIAALSFGFTAWGRRSKRC
jgi:fibronectin-binding autotransporter adhesin